MTVGEVCPHAAPSQRETDFKSGFDLQTFLIFLKKY